MAAVKEEPNLDTAPLYEKLGGKAAVHAAVDIFYTKVVADKELTRFFEGTDMAALKSHQKDFMTYAFGGGANYTGRSMEEAHKDLIEKKGLNQYHWGLVAGHLVSSLEDLSVPQTLIDEVVAVVGTTKDVFPPAPEPVAAKKNTCSKKYNCPVGSPKVAIISAGAAALVLILGIVLVRR